jgi:hypothetical protein
VVNGEIADERFGSVEDGHDRFDSIAVRLHIFFKA